MYQFLDPIFGLLIFITLIVLTLLTMVLSQSLSGKPTRFRRWIYNSLKPHQQSVIFWNGVYWALFISLTLVWPTIGAGISAIGSLLYLASIIDQDDFKNQTWPLSTFLFWFILIMGGIGFSLYWIYKNTILKFNNFLDKRHTVK